MSKIKILPPQVAAKIAAGEVVERPASVVKELIENSIDAQADQITIQLEQGGIGKIRVVDNGQGMDKDDLLKCFKQHGTSKISSAEDLNQVRSLGFRGEALYSITSVSKTTIQSKTGQERSGNQVVINGGKVERISPVGIPRGTQIIVENIFFNLPARKKFLKKERTELLQIINVVTKTGLAFPKIGFFLNHNQKTILDLPKNQTLAERVETLLGKALFPYLIPIEIDRPHFNLKGFIGKPQIARENRSKQYLFVNHRPVVNQVASAAVSKAYGSLIPPKSHPLFILFINLPPQLVDVNIHPRKQEIKFINSSFVFHTIYQAVLNQLENSNLTFKAESYPFITDSKKITTSLTDKQKAEKKYSYSFKKTKRPKNNLFLDQTKEEKLPWEQSDIGEKTQEIIQIHNLYLISQTPNGLLIVDQHAAHERILYESLLKGFTKNKDKPLNQSLLIPLTLNLSLSETQLLTENLPVLKKIGFEIEEFGKNSFKITSVPHPLKDRDVKGIISEVLDDILEEKPIRDVDKKSLRLISYLACRSAIKAGDYLTLEQRENLLKQLGKTKTNYTCPHGRPAKIKIDLKELNKMFKRR